MAMAMGFPSWVYEVKDEDPDEIKHLNNKILDEVIENVASHASSNYDFAKSIVFWGGRIHEDDAPGLQLHVNFRDRRIVLPDSICLNHCSLSTKIEANSVRYAAFLPNSQLYDKERLHTVVLSTWELNKDIHNIYLALDGKGALTLVNAVLRLITEVVASPERTHGFRPILTGRVKVSVLSGEEYAKFEKQEFEPIVDEMHFILDREAISFFANKFSSKPGFDFRFYKEPSRRSLDFVLVSKDFGHLELRTSENGRICIIKKLDDPADAQIFDELIKVFRNNTIQSNPEATYTGDWSEAKWSQNRFSRLSQNRLPAALDNEGNEEVWQRPTEEQLGVQWLNDLYTGDHLTRNENEALMVEWVTYSYDLEECIKEDRVPHSSIESGGLDPKSTQHLLTTIEDIKDQLLKQRMDVALSHLRGCMKVFGKTLLSPLADLEEVENMKRIFFLTG